MNHLYFLNLLLYICLIDELPCHDILFSNVSHPDNFRSIFQQEFHFLCLHF